MGNPARPLLTERQGTWTIAAAVAAALGAALLLGTEALVATAYFYDDQFYYFQIARNVAAGKGFTFDGLHATNGFHPLWLMLLAPVFGLVAGDGAPLRVVAAIEVVLVALAAIGIFRALRPRLGEAPALVASLFVVAQPGATHVFRVGMESSLLLFLMVVVWRRWLALDGQASARPAGWLGLGGLCALAFLTRPEAAMALPVLVFLGRRRWRADPRAAAALLAPGIACAAAYLAWNRLAFGTWLPISAMVKARWTEAPWAIPASPMHHVATILHVPWFGERILHHALPTIFARVPAARLVLAVLLVAAAWRWRGPLGEAVRASGAAFVLLSSALIVLVDKVIVLRLMEWHEVPIFFTTSVLAGALLWKTPRLAHGALVVALVACAARGALTLWRARDAADHTVYYVMQASDWLGRNAGPGDRVGSWAGGGILGYFSGRHVVILDGLVNDLAFYRRVVEGGDLEGYLESEGISWLAGPACGPSPGFSDAFPPGVLPPQARGRLPGEFELVRGFYREPGGCPGFTLWRLRPLSSPSGRVTIRPPWPIWTTSWPSTSASGRLFQRGS